MKLLQNTDIHSQKIIPHNKKLLGFTLVELIVVITILAILGTIAFLSLVGYLSNARDSSRISDINNISKALALAEVKTGTYPLPDTAFSVTYSGGVLWYQGTVGDTVMNVVSAAGSKINKKPTDPLSGTEYIYSKLAYNKAFQLKADYEGDVVAYTPNPLIDTAFAAAGNPTLSYIKGNYNGIAAKTTTSSGSICIIASPSIVTSSGTTVGSGIVVNTLVNKILYHGQTNSGGVIYTPQPIYCSGSLPSNDIERNTFASGVVFAYSGTALASELGASAFIDLSNNSGALTTMGKNFVVMSLGGSDFTASPVIVPPAPLPSPYLNIDGSMTSYVSDSASGAARFVAINTAVTQDLVTGLMWQSYRDSSSADYIANYNTTSTWVNAFAYCSGVTIGGMTGWRLPDHTELHSIIDYSRPITVLAPVDPVYFGSKSTNYWTSTTYAASTTSAWYISFNEGNAITNSKGTSNNVRCVR